MKTFTKADGSRVAAILAINWLISVLVGASVIMLSDADFIASFTAMFAICCAAPVLGFMIKRNFLSAVLMVCGAMILFSLTVVLHSALSV